MNGAILYTLTSNFLGGQQMDETLFYQLLNMAKDQREMMRDWVKLRAYDTSITFTSSDTYLTGKTLPTRFLRTYGVPDFNGRQKGVFIVTSNGSKVALTQIPMADRYDYRDKEGYFYIDHANGTIARTGLTEGTLHLNYLKGTVAIDADTTWTLPPSDGFGALLAYDVSVENKGSIDWDRINASQIPYSLAKMRQLETNLSTWDARLQQAELGV